ncbi:hypothetical protein ARSEF4850_001410 [Beauveria asiatica]
MTARAFLTGHSRQEKEVARKCGPSLQRKSMRLGAKANIRTLTLYEDPTHGFWHIAKHCPNGKTFPDVGRLVEEFSRTGKRPTVRDVHARRPGPSAARHTDTSSRRRSTRNAPKPDHSIYDVPDDDDSETLCSASILCRVQSTEREEWGPDESTVGDASPAEAADMVETADATGEHGTMGQCDAVEERDAVEEADMTEHNAMGEINTLAEADAVPEDDHAATMEQMGWETEYTAGMDMTGMENTLIWDAENATSMEDPLAWEPEIDMEGWDAYGPETSGQDLQSGFSAVATRATQHTELTSMKLQETMTEDLSRKWAAFARREAVALQRRYIACLW